MRVIKSGKVHRYHLPNVLRQNYICNIIHNALNLLKRIIYIRYIGI